MFKKIARTCAPLAIVFALAAPAAAHVTVQPNEAVQGSFSRFVVRVPNEKPDAGTIKIEVRLPALAFVSFEPKEGWQRQETTGKFDEPIEAFGEELTEGVTRVVWSGGRIGPGEFLEFGFSAKMPDEETTLTFEALQTYEGGEVVKWTGAPDSEAPAALVKTYDIGAAEGEGQLGVLARLADQSGGSDEDPAAEEPAEGSDEPATAAPVVDEDDDDDDEEETLPLVLSGGALVVAAAALFLALKRR